MLEDVLAIPDHLRDALFRVESARLEPREAAGVLVCGMGGSAVGGDLAAAALGTRCTKPILTVRGYELPVWATPDHTVLCSSYSGNTEETIACFEGAGALGARRVACTTGGELAERAREAGVPVVGLPGILQPRAAVAYMVVVAAEVAALAGAAPRIHTEIDGAAAHLERSRQALRGRAEQVAEELHGSIPVIYGADLTIPVARRWKTQVNENAKSPAFASDLPEADHNEIEGWSGAGGAPLSAVFLADADQHPRERRRIELTARLAGQTAAAVAEVETEGETRSQRQLWAVMLGDLVSVALAERRGIDPDPVTVLERLKQDLGRA
ncbi:MAG TPA: bifunctional phosphoglucose/phosphomannose isomerase [Solirubrobacterales bacterium]|nr:bifunctional phosphoglucose/phosphomannose isomerase [Solirubrobacterales bacterium]